MSSCLVPLAAAVVTGMLPYIPAVPASVQPMITVSSVHANRDNSGTSWDHRKNEMPQPSAKSGVTASNQMGAKKPGFCFFGRASRRQPDVLMAGQLNPRRPDGTTLAGRSIAAIACEN